MPNAARDQNRNPTMIGVSSIDKETIVRIAVNPTTNALLIDSTSLFSGLDSRYVNVAGDVMSGQLTVPLINGSSADNGDITINGTSSVTKTTSYVILQATAGNVGIGTTEPTAKLEVLPSPGDIALKVGRMSGNPSIRGISDTDWLIADAGTSGRLGLNFWSTGDVVLVNGGGNVGIGIITSGSKLQVNGNAAIGYSESTAGPTKGLAISGNVGIGTTEPNRTLGIGGLVARNIGMERGTVANTAGFALTLNAGAATVAATNKAGGILYLDGGISTGTGVSGVEIRTSPAGSTGTADNSVATMIKVSGNTLGFYGVTAVVRPTALTATGTYTLNTGDAGSDMEITLMRTRINELETKLQSLGFLT